MPAFERAPGDASSHGRDCRCGHKLEDHEHFRPGYDCGLCECQRFKDPRLAAGTRDLLRSWSAVLFRHRPSGRGGAARRTRPPPVPVHVIAAATEPGNGDPGR
jgi:hypothetical protein